jgi:hypothetical protein
MKIVEQMRYPHPVLWSQTSDFTEGGFGFRDGTLCCEEHPSQVLLTGEIQLSNGDIERMVTAGEVVMGVSVICEETYFSQIYPFSAGPFIIECPPQALAGEVECRPIAWTARDIRITSLGTLDCSFWTLPLEISSGAVIAIGERDIASIGQAKLAPITSVFTLVLDQARSEGQFLISFEDDHLQIRSGREAHHTISKLRASMRGKVALLNGVYLPVVQRVIEELKQSESEHIGKTWYRVFKAKLAHCRIDVSTCDTLEAAQLLLREPIKRIRLET